MRIRRDSFGAALAVVLALLAEARADEVSPAASGIDEPSIARRVFPGRGASLTRTSPAQPAGAAGWWLGTAGIALALAVCGWASVASRRYSPRPASATAALRVVGRASLSPKHSVYLLQVGDRVLIVGAGGQAAPSLLGELRADEAATPRVDTPPAGRFEHRLEEGS